MWSADDKALERAIDEVAREMTAGEPDAGVRARVMARLEGHTADEGRAIEIPSRSQTRWASTRVAHPASVWRRRAWIVAPAAVAVLLAVFLMRDRRTHAPADTAPTVAQSASPPPAAGEPPTPQRADAEPTPRAVEGSDPAAPSPAPTVAASAPTARLSEVAALAPPPLAMPSIQLNAIDPAASIALPRLHPIEPITVTPIGEPQGERP